MRSIARIAFVFLFCILFTLTSFLGAENTAINSPSAFLPVDSYEFAPVLEGVQVTYNFIIRNKGTATLKIEKVKTGCGCTDVSYSRQIPPGGEEKITVKVNTRGYGGRRVSKNIFVQTNDINNSRIKLTVSGKVEKFASIVPRRVMLVGPAGKQIKTEVTIIPQEKYPFKIVRVRTKKQENINFKLKEVKGSKRTTYLLTIENLKKLKGKYYDTIYLKTDSKIRPEIRINVYGNILDIHQKGEKQE